MDGEGHLGVSLNNSKRLQKPYYRATIQVGMSHEPTIDHLFALFGGSKYTPPPPKYENWKQLYHWRTQQHQHQYDLLSATYPYLITKQEYAKLFLAFLENKLGNSPDLIYQMELAIQMKGLK